MLRANHKIVIRRQVRQAIKQVFKKNVQGKNFVLFLVDKTIHYLKDEILQFACSDIPLVSYGWMLPKHANMPCMCKKGKQGRTSKSLRLIMYNNTRPSMRLYSIELFC